jgi:hypothetical protein
MSNHLVVTWVFYLLEWLDPHSDTISTNFGILQTLRFFGPVLVLSLALAWHARPGLVLKITLFSLLALAFRFPVKGYALDAGLIWSLPKHAGLYFASLLAFFYGLGPVDSNPSK